LRFSVCPGYRGTCRRQDDCGDLTVNRAVGPSFDAAHVATTTRDAADEAVETARANAAAHAAAVLTGTASHPPASIESARQALQQADDALTTAHAARTAIDAQLAHAQQDVTDFERRIRSAALTVIATEAGAALATKADRLRRELVADKLTLRWLVHRF
jgi:hypothetical protein